MSPVTGLIANHMIIYLINSIALCLYLTILAHLLNDIYSYYYAIMIVSLTCKVVYINFCQQDFLYEWRKIARVNTVIIL